MSFLTALFAKPQASIDEGDFGLGGNWVSLAADSGVVVNEKTAMRLVAVYACVTLIADTVRSLPADVLRASGDTRVPVARPPGWITTPNRDQTWGQFIDYALHSLLTHGNAFIWLPSRDALGFPDVLQVIHPADVSVDNRNGRKEIRVNGERLREYTAMQPSGNVLHILGHTADGLIGLSPIEQAKQAIGSGLAIEAFGNAFFKNGATPSAVLEMPAGSQPTQPQLEAVARAFDRKHGGTKNAWTPIVLANGASYKPMTVPNDQAQFIESAKLSVAEIARLYRVPPHLIGDVERSTSWGTGIEEQNIAFVTYTLTPWITRFEESLSLLVPRGQYVKFNTKGLLRGDVSSRVSFYEAFARMQASTINEVRALEDMPPLPDGDRPPPLPNESL